MNEALALKRYGLKRQAGGYHEMYERLGSYLYDQDPPPPGWTPLIPNNRWADPKGERVPNIST